MRYFKLAGLLALLSLVSGFASACTNNDDPLVVYSGRSSNLVQPLLEQFHEDTGIAIQVRYGSSSGIASTILEEGSKSVADAVFLQDPGALGALSQEGMLQELEDSILNRVDSRFHAANKQWVGTSGRARTVIYNTDAINPEKDLPASIGDFTDPKWKGRIGWAPPNGSFQAFVTALRVQLGDNATKEWLEGIIANDVIAFPNNITTVAAAARGEIDVGFVNHYYLEQFLEEEGEGYGARNHFIGNGDPGALVLVAGAGILKSSDNQKNAEKFIEYLLGSEAQKYFSEETKEYPLSAEVKPSGNLPSLESLNPPNVDLNSLDDLRSTIALLQEVGALQ